MSLLVSLEIALRALASNKMRSGLTMLGIIIGISAVIVLVSVGQGVQTMVAEQMEDVGANLMFVMPGELEASNSSMKSNFLRSANTSTLTLKDAEALADPAKRYCQMLWIKTSSAANIDGVSVNTSATGSCRNISASPLGNSTPAFTRATW